MFLRIKPLDTLFFRSARPMTMGVDTWGEVIFPPFPSTLYGAIRSFMIFQRGTLKDFLKGKYKEDLGTPDEEGKLSLLGPLLLKDDQVLFPLPLDLVRSEEGNLVPLKLKTVQMPFLSDYKPRCVFVWDGKGIVKDASGFLTQKAFVNYLTGRADRFEGLEGRDVFLYEEKIGIARERATLTSKEGHLYRIPLIRLKEGVGMLVKVEGVEDIPSSGVLQLGGENKGAVFRALEDNPLREIEELSSELVGEVFKIYIATPAIFQKGWLPQWMDETNLQGEWKGIRLRLISASIGKPLRVGGWDLAKGRPKRMYKAVPPGSIYCFQVMGHLNNPQRLLDAFHLKNISDVNPKEGFGLSIMGKVEVHSLREVS